MKNLFVLCLFVLSSCYSVQNPFKMKISDSLPLHSFVSIEHAISFMGLDPKKGIRVRNLQAKASGSVVHASDKGSYVLTAGHACKKKLMLEEFKNLKQVFSANSIKITTHQGKSFKAKVKKIYEKSDLCLLFIEKLKNIPVVTLSETPPSPGDRVYNIAAPLGISEKNFFLIYEGFYAGLKEEKAWYSFFSNNGSSGSMILNKQGELVGIVTHAVVEASASLGPTLSSVKNIIKTNIK